MEKDRLIGRCENLSELGKVKYVRTNEHTAHTRFAKPIQRIPHKEWQRGRHTRVRSCCCDWVYKLKPALDKASVTCLLFTKSTIGIIKYEITGKRNCILQVFSSFKQRSYGLRSIKLVTQILRNCYIKIISSFVCNITRL